MHRSRFVMIDLANHRPFYEYWVNLYPDDAAAPPKRRIIKHMREELGIAVRFERAANSGRMYLHPHDAEVFKLKFG